MGRLADHERAFRQGCREGAHEDRFIVDRFVVGRRRHGNLAQASGNRDRYRQFASQPTAGAVEQRVGEGAGDPRPGGDPALQPDEVGGCPVGQQNPGLDSKVVLERVVGVPGHAPLERPEHQGSAQGEDQGERGREPQRGRGEKSRLGHLSCTRLHGLYGSAPDRKGDRPWPSAGSCARRRDWSGDRNESPISCPAAWRG